MRLNTLNIATLCSLFDHRIHRAQDSRAPPLPPRRRYWGFPPNFPPGPPCVPLLGVLPFIGADFRAAIERWREDYGDVVGVKLGSELAVVLSDYGLVET